MTQPTQPSAFQKTLNYVLIFLIALMAFQFFSKGDAEVIVDGDDLILGIEEEITLGKPVVLTLKNNTANELIFAQDCPAEPFDVSRYENGTWLLEEATIANGSCDPSDLVLAAGELREINYMHWQGGILHMAGQYRIEVPVTIAGTDKVFKTEFAITESGFFGGVWDAIFYKPIYNALIFLTGLTGSSFGWGIVLLTIIIRLILFFPFQKSMASQRRMQTLQPEIERIRKQYKDNQQMIATETMALYKKHGVNPFSSCLPILIQLPFLLALFWIVQGGLGENNFVMLYQSLADFDVTIVSTNFYGLDLLGVTFQSGFTDVLLLALPLAVAGLQFTQMKLAFAKRPQTAPNPDNPMADAMQNMTKYMLYFLPGMIAVFTATMPAAVGLYWGTSTLFGIGQQLIVNKTIK